MAEEVTDGQEEDWEREEEEQAGNVWYDEDGKVAGGFSEYPGGRERMRKQSKGKRSETKRIKGMMTKARRNEGKRKVRKRKRSKMQWRKMKMS